MEKTKTSPDIETILPLVSTPSSDAAMRAIGFSAVRLIGGFRGWLYNFTEQEYPYLFVTHDQGVLPETWADDVDVEFHQDDESDAIIDQYPSLRKLVDDLLRAENGNRFGLGEALTKSGWGQKATR